MNKICSWRFISNQNSTIYGINDAGIETFTANIIHSLVRETIQNSLDARLDINKPVVVEFNKFNLPIEDFPDSNRYESILQKCLKSNNDEVDATRFFKNAIEKFDKPLEILRVSDFNTYGLVGAEKCDKGSSWSRLVKESGSSNKGQTSGGSFGIGKSAVFACSDLRTIFYSSLANDNIESHIGVTRLVSFKDDEIGGWTTGIGYYSDSEKLTAIMGQVQFDSSFSRTSTGTDIYILGLSKMEEFDKEIIKSVLINFLVSIWKSQLVVIVNGETISRSSLSHFIGELNPFDGKEIKEVINYYELLSGSNPSIIKIELDNNEYGKKYGFENGECTLYLTEGEGLNSRILMTRSAGMKLFNQDRINGNIDFTGILMIEGEKMNQAFRKMEVPSHDAWEPGRCKEESKIADNMYKDLRKYLRDKVKFYYERASDVEIDAFGASDFLPDIMNNESNKAKGTIKEKLVDQVKNLLGKDMNPKKKSSRQVAIKDSPKTDDDENKERKSRKANGKGKNNGNHEDDDKGFKYVDINKRLICIDREQGLYSLKYVAPHYAKRARLDFIVDGEQSEFNVPVKEAIVKTNNTIVQKINENSIYLKDIRKSDVITINLKIDFNQYCLMEANYYENKK